jgi:hypothetical protein
VRVLDPDPIDVLGPDDDDPCKCAPSRISRARAAFWIAIVMLLTAIANHLDQVIRILNWIFDFLHVREIALLLQQLLHAIHLVLR